MYKIHRTKSSIERADKHGPRKCEEAYIDVCGLWLCLKKDPTFPDALLIPSLRLLPRLHHFYKNISMHARMHLLARR
jgi:hypothetical protein